MDYSSTLSNNTIIIIVVVVLIIVGIIILIAIFNNNNNNDDGSGPVLMSKIDENKGKLEVIIDKQDKQTEIMSDIINSLNDLSSNKSNRFSINESNNNGNNDSSSLINEDEIFNDKSSDNEIFNKKLDNDSSSILYDDDKKASLSSISSVSSVSSDSPLIKNEEVVFYHKDETLNSSEVDKLDFSSESKIQDFQPASIDFQHESFSDTTESFTGQSFDEPSMIKKDLKLSDFNIHNQKIPIKDKSPQKKISIPLPKAKLPIEGVSPILPKSSKLDPILNSDLSSPDDETILRVNKKIPLPKNHKK